jgi:hypothetical protein
LGSEDICLGGFGRQREVLVAEQMLQSLAHEVRRDLHLLEVVQIGGVVELESVAPGCSVGFWVRELPLGDDLGCGGTG